MADITPALQEKIEESFRRNLENNKEIVRLQKLLETGKATWEDADKYAVEVGVALGNAFYGVSGADLPDGRMYYNIASRVIPSGLHAVYDDVSEYALAIQKGLNERNKIGLNALKAEYNELRERDIVDMVSDAADYDAIKGALTEQAEAFSQGVVTNTMETNAEAQHQAGLTVTVDREYDGIGLHDRKDECNWCKERAGHWEYKDAIKYGVFQRHPGCHCIIVYNGAKGRQVHTDWRRNQWRDVEPRLRLPAVAASTITEKVKSGEYRLRLTRQQYDKHVSGTKEYVVYEASRKKKGLNAQSRLTISYEEAQRIIEEKSGTGIIKVRRDGSPTNVEWITCDRIVGQYCHHGQFYPTNKAMLIHGKKGTHIVPHKGNKYD